jgi:oligopeptide/dipeptide ABC transporter ATP-binding protein
MMRKSYQKQRLILMNHSCIEIKNITKQFRVKKGIIDSIIGRNIFINALNDVSFNINKEETFGLAGESGCGKTTLGKILSGTVNPSKGEIYFNGINIGKLKGIEKKRFRRKVQMVYQDPYGSLDPRYSIYDTVSEPLIIHNIGKKEDRHDRVYKMLENVYLDPPEEFMYRHPHELSGGQRQRVSIARAMILNPEFIVLDEPVSMLDTSVRSSIIDLLLKIKENNKITYLVVTHDMSVMRYFSDRIAIMYLGKIMEITNTEKLIRNPVHPYTQIMMSAVPIPNPTMERNRIELKGEITSNIELPKGCFFSPRCPYCKNICEEKTPELNEIEKDHLVACHLNK